MKTTAGYTDLDDACLIREHAIHMTAERLHWDLKRDDCPAQGLYIIWLEENCLYIGRSHTDLYARVSEHFHPRRKCDLHRALPFTIFCQEHLPELASAVIWLMPPEICQTIVRKSLFLDREEYEKHAPHDEEYQAWIASNPKKYLSLAEMALMALFHPKYNERGNNPHSPTP
jgi:hypothetical protein